MNIGNPVNRETISVGVYNEVNSAMMTLILNAISQPVRNLIGFNILRLKI